VGVRQRRQRPCGPAGRRPLGWAALAEHRRAAAPASRVHLRLRGGRTGQSWLVGGGAPYERPFVLHWNGRRWGVLDLRAIVVRAPRDVWAVGTVGLGEPVSFAYSDLVLHWDGRHWTRVPSPLERGFDSGPFAIAADTASSGDLWTANQDLSGNPPVFVRFPPQGRATIAAPALDIDPNDLEAVSATSGWVAGTTDDPPESLLMHWDGPSWVVEHIPYPGLKAEPEWSLSALSPTDVWAAGARLLARYSC
jgi:hypothetical protein